MIENTFYIVWLDPHHNLYPMRKHGGIKIVQPGKSEIEILHTKLEECEQKYLELEQLLEEMTEPKVNL